MHDSALPAYALLDEVGQPIRLCNYCDEPLSSRRGNFHAECVEPAKARTAKACTACRECKPISAFARRAGTADGWNVKCRACVSEYRMLITDAKPDMNLNAHLLRKFGISLEQFRALEKAQGGRCAICHRPPPHALGQKSRRQGRAVRPRLVVDHDHKTGRIRGLLCTPCNRGIGFLDDNPERVSAALAYLEGDRGRWPMTA